MGNLTQNLKTRFSGLVESVKSWRTARGIEDYEDLESQTTEHARAVSGSKVPPRPNVLKGLPARIH
ncbi:hypothetical protein DCAR_0312950 [Daucus carota subsp. sativus]|uniref:Uncharacterized protein n=1 Tax=Daucus carota subsp. sativus TaxID=79200 RepID=A0A166BPA1_DAUCS|nr:hypothetical protein DCAR_0312950 [Daucus carota subsp. sativus]